jgi:hypothetical protein
MITFFNILAGFLFVCISIGMYSIYSAKQAYAKNKTAQLMDNVRGVNRTFHVHKVALLLWSVSLCWIISRFFQ